MSIDPDLRVYVDAFKDEGAAQGRDIVIDNLFMHFVTTLPDTIDGQCSSTDRDSISTPRILINANTWGSMSEIIRKVLTFHELGHCVLYREHITTMTNGIPTSLMYPYIFLGASDMYAQFWAYYMHELFN